MLRPCEKGAWPDGRDRLNALLRGWCTYFCYDTASPAENYLFLTKNQCPDVDFFIVDTKGKWILSEVLNRIKAGRDDSRRRGCIR
ncbi:hypothetical protein C6A37_01415 [Desulfobacteraceae bacterium SEEP-SAG9]|nr:hypothetical protein C6A37_01415 [Desulfobacteraceae bacterium SEEP-SAG9]